MDVAPHFGSAVVGSRIAPGRVRSPVVVEVDAAFVVLRPAIETPEVQITRPEVVVHDVEDHGHATLVCRGDETLECVGSTVVGFESEGLRRVVAPGKPARELHGRHQLDGGHPQLGKMVQVFDGAVEVAGRTARFVPVRANVKLVQDEFIPSWRAVLVKRPLETRVHDDAIADGTRHVARVGIVL